MEDSSELTADEWKAVAEIRRRNAASGPANGGNTPLQQEGVNNGIRTDSAAGAAGFTGEPPPFTDRFGIADEFSELRERFAAEAGEDSDFEQGINRRKPRRGDINVRPYRL